MIESSVKGIRSRWSARERCDRFMGWLLEDQYNKGLGGPPNNWQGITVLAESSPRDTKSHTLYFTNDAFELVLGTTYVENETRESVSNIIIRVEPFRRLALWYLWRWVWGEWFGLRRRLFYVRLHHVVAGYERVRQARLEEKAALDAAGVSQE